MDKSSIRLHYPNMNERPAIRGAVPTYRLYREDSGESGDFWIHCETIPVRSRLHNWEIAAHRHDRLFQVFAVTDGRGEILIDGAYRPFSAPCALFIPAGAVHGFRFAHDTDGLVATVLADRLDSLTAADRRIAAFAAAPRAVEFAGVGGDAKTMLDSLARIHAELAGEGTGRTLLLEALTTETIVHLVRAAGAAASPIGVSNRRERRRIEELQTLIGAHFREHRPVSFYAGMLGMSAAHLNRLAREATGLSVQKLVAKRLVEAARRDLIFTPTPVQAIAFSLGFSDPAYFNRFFKKLTGMTPGAYRERERQRLAG